MPFWKQRGSRQSRSRGPDLTTLSEDALRQIKEQVGSDKFGQLMKKSSGGKSLSSKASPDRRTTDGIVFDSIWEMDVYIMLRDALGKDSVEMQVPYVLQPSFVDGDNKRRRAITYIADFVVDGKWVGDAKGFVTEKFKMKEKMFAAKHPDSPIQRMPYKDRSSVQAFINKCKHKRTQAK